MLTNVFVLTSTGKTAGILFFLERIHAGLILDLLRQVEGSLRGLNTGDGWWSSESAPQPLTYIFLWPAKWIQPAV